MNTNEPLYDSKILQSMNSHSFLISVTCISYLSLIPSIYGWIPRMLYEHSRGDWMAASDLPQEQWFGLQKLDHFNGKDVTYWKQRYFMNDTFHVPGCPIFLMLAGREEANPVWLTEGAWIQYAKTYKALLVMLEHRFYGKSQPLPDLSTKSLAYLSSQQALADVANFISFFRTLYSLNETNKLILFGVSYGGSLSAWFRSKYPYMVDGAVASSAPMLAKMQFPEYYQVVKESLDATGPQCAMEIKNATATMEGWWNQADKRRKMKNMFQLCDKIKHGTYLDRVDRAGVFSSLAWNFGHVVQYNNDNIRFRGAVGTNITIQTVCEIMTDDSRGPAIQRYADVNSLMLKTFSESCLDFTYLKLIKDLKETSWNSTAAQGARQWFYQMCTEFGWFKSSGSLKQPFGTWFMFPFNYTMTLCRDVFGDIYILENIDQTNRFYGGLKLPGSKIILTNGSLDPWHSVGITNGTDTEVDVIYINGTAHGADMYPPSSMDPPQLVTARQKIEQNSVVMMRGRQWVELNSTMRRALLHHITDGDLSDFNSYILRFNFGPSYVLFVIIRCKSLR